MEDNNLTVTSLLPTLNLRELLFKSETKEAAKEVAKVLLVTGAVCEVLKATKEIVKLCIDFKKA